MSGAVQYSVQLRARSRHHHENKAHEPEQRPATPSPSLLPLLLRGINALPQALPDTPSAVQPEPCLPPETLSQILSGMLAANVCHAYPMQTMRGPQSRVPTQNPDQDPLYRPRLLTRAAQRTLLMQMIAGEPAARRDARPCMTNSADGFHKRIPHCKLSNPHGARRLTCRPWRAMRRERCGCPNARQGA